MVCIPVNRTNNMNNSCRTTYNTFLTHPPYQLPYRGRDHFSIKVRLSGCFSAHFKVKGSLTRTNQHSQSRPPGAADLICPATRPQVRHTISSQPEPEPRSGVAQSEYNLCRPPIIANMLPNNEAQSVTRMNHTVSRA